MKKNRFYKGLSFLFLTTVVYLSLEIGPGGYAKEISRTSSIFCFAQITDSHIDSTGVDYPPYKLLSQSKKILRLTLQEIVSAYHPQVVIHTGDISDKGTMDDLKSASDILNEEVGSIWYVVPGNHDKLLGSSNYLSTFGKICWVINDESTNSVLVGIDSAKDMTVEGTISSEQIEFLEDVLKDYANTNATFFLFLHHPPEDITNAQNLKDILQPRVKNYRKILVFAGHQHRNRKSHLSEISCFVTSSLIEYPMQYRIVKVREDSIEVLTVGPSSPKLAQQSLDRGASKENLGEDKDRYALISLPQDSTSPKIISQINVVDVCKSKVTILWDTDEPSDSRVIYGEKTPLEESFADLNMVITHRVTLTNLKWGTTYFFKVQSRDFAGNAVTNDNEGNFFTFTTLSAEKFVLHQNYPNPFTYKTTIEYELPRSCQITLKIYTISGELVKTLIDDYQSKGYYSISWDGRNERGESVARGVYIYSLVVDGFIRIKKMAKLGYLDTYNHF
ncbi:metallophosphoesterase [Candidatus Aerophobetes bacterium]|nr:metallophosphoesterase [Candidatus Aerophobetes bacterium]